MSVHLSFESLEINRSSGSESVRLSFYSSVGKDELEAWINANFAEGSDSTRGHVDGHRYYQSGPVWYCEVSCSTQYGPGGIAVTVTSAPQKHSLRSVRVSLQLERHPAYRTKWNRYLWCSVPADYADLTFGGTPPSYGSRTTDEAFHENGFDFRWTRTADPPGGKPENGVRWACLAGPAKPGVESWDYNTYQITEYGEYASEEQAAWVTAVLLNRIRPTPLLGDFGLASKLPGSGWNWKCDDASVEHNGKKWAAQLVWTLSGDANGWDADLYDAAQSTNATPGLDMPGGGSAS